MKVLRAELGNLGISKVPPFVCTCQLSRKINLETDIHRLAHLAGLFDITLNAHRALSDATACALLLKNMSKRSSLVKEQIEKAKFEITELPEPMGVHIEPQIRKSVEVLDRDENLAHETYTEIISSGKRQVALTGTPKIGKAAFAELLDSVGYFYKETTPGPRNTAFWSKQM